MAIHKVPVLDFDDFAVGDILDLFSNNEIKINAEYQRGEVWTDSQKIELIKSINAGYSIGVLVLFKNEDGQYEILDGQQRLSAIKQYLSDVKWRLKGAVLKKYSKLTSKEKRLFDAYHVYYLEIKGFDSAHKQEDVVQTFLRLQEGTPLNKAEKINAYPGKFKDTFKELRETHGFFTFLSNDVRFRLRLLAAEILLLELDSDFNSKTFPSLDLENFKIALKKYETRIDLKKLAFLESNLNILVSSLDKFLTAFKPRDLISLYLLMSYLRKRKANVQSLPAEFKIFSQEFHKNIVSFSIYDKTPPAGLSYKIFKKYLLYKTTGRQATTSESLRSRFDFILAEYKRLFPFIKKDIKRVFDTKDKRTLFFLQKGICKYCERMLDFRGSSADHKISYASGGPTRLKNAQLLHAPCHAKIEKSRRSKKRR